MTHLQVKREFPHLSHAVLVSHSSNVQFRGGDLSPPNKAIHCVFALAGRPARSSRQQRLAPRRWDSRRLWTTQCRSRVPRKSARRSRWPWDWVLRCRRRFLLCDRIAVPPATRLRSRVYRVVRAALRLMQLAQQRYSGFCWQCRTVSVTRVRLKSRYSRKDGLLTLLLRVDLQAYCL